VSLDPFEVIGEIPDHLSYQWVAVRIMGSYQAAASALRDRVLTGWTPVPWKRHPQMQDDRGIWIVVQDCLLMQKPKEDVQRELERLTKVALDMHAEALTGLELAAYAHKPKFSDADIDNMRCALPTRNGTNYVEVTIGMAISDHQFELATSYLDLTPREYMQRLVHMDTNLLFRHQAPRAYFEWLEMPIFDRLENDQSFRFCMEKTK
jgi:hypothetical protein